MNRAERQRRERAAVWHERALRHATLAAESAPCSDLRVRAAQAVTYYTRQAKLWRAYVALFDTQEIARERMVGGRR